MPARRADRSGHYLGPALGQRVARRAFQHTDTAVLAAATRANVVRLGTVRAPRNPLDLDALRIEGENRLRVSLRSAATEVTHEQTIDGASTLTMKVRDPERGLLRSNIVKTKSTLTLDNVPYRLVKVARAGNELTLTFEETAVNVLREYDSPRKANRDSMTRAQFVKSLVDEPKGFVIPFRCPELNNRQPVAAQGGS